MSNAQNDVLDKKRERWQRAGLILGTIIIAFAMVWINTYLRSAKYFREGESFRQEAKFLDAITSYETAAHAYTPWNSNVKLALDRLWEIGVMYESENDDPDYALVAFRSLRSSIYAIRSFYWPYYEWIAKCDTKIDHLVTIQKQRIELQKSQQKLLFPE